MHIINWRENEIKLMANRWLIYQKERFPVCAHGALIFSFSFCAVSFSAQLRTGEWPCWQSVLVAFISCFIFFVQLRIADEFKDNDEDMRWRPYRPVPRGLIKLSELGWVFVGGAVVQLVVALWWHRYLVFILLGAWIYLAAMSFEFGARKWLKARPITYLWTHMLIMPIVDFYATASDWIPAGDAPHSGLVFFLIASFCNGIVIEVGRKIRVPEQEEEGVDTYSRLWGPKRAAAIWWGCICATAFFATLAAASVDAALWIGSFLSLLVLGLGIFVRIFCTEQRPVQAKAIEIIAGVWTIILYLSLGIIPAIST